MASHIQKLKIGGLTAFWRTISVNSGVTPSTEIDGNASPVGKGRLLWYYNPPPPKHHHVLEDWIENHVEGRGFPVMGLCEA